MPKPIDASAQLIDALHAMGKGVSGAKDAFIQSLAELANTEGQSIADAMAYFDIAERFFGERGSVIIRKQQADHIRSSRGCP